MMAVAERAPGTAGQHAAAGLRDTAVVRADSSEPGWMIERPPGGPADIPGPEDAEGTAVRAWLRRVAAGGSWPLIILAVPAAVAVWSGWVRLGQMTGFGLVRPFPGLWDSFRVNTAITLPVGVEAYGAYALRAWLDASPGASDQTRAFAKWSAIGSLLLGMSGQVAYHLLSEAGVVRAPWGITMAVACLPVLVLGMGAALAHLRHADAARIPEQAGSSSQRTIPGPEGGSGSREGCGSARDDGGGEVVTERLEFARLTALQLTSTGVRVSRRTLREAGVKGSNAELSTLVKTVTSQLSDSTARS